jgi:hypothetical protein
LILDNLESLQELRLRLHRLEPSRPLRDVRAAAAFVRERKVVLAAGRSSLPMLAEAIVGHPIRGSWMADPEVFRIYRLMRRLHRSPDVATVSLIQGKETFVDAALGPVVERIAGDRARRAAAIRSLPPLARKLLGEVESSGEVRMDHWSASQDAGRAARLRLVEQWLAVSSSIHTESGYHTALVRSWAASSVAVRFGKAARRLDYEDAQRQLWLAAVRSAVLVSEREARRWFPIDEVGLADLIVGGEIMKLRVRGGKFWLTPAR